MLSRAATRTSTSVVTKRGFHATRPRLSSPFHYPEGPYSNIPFNPKSKWFGVGYWGFMATGFFAPFGIAGECFTFSRSRVVLTRGNSLPELQDSVKALCRMDEFGYKKIGTATTLLGGWGMLCTKLHRYQHDTSNRIPFVDDHTKPEKGML